MTGVLHTDSGTEIAYEYKQQQTWREKGYEGAPSHAKSRELGAGWQLGFPNEIALVWALPRGCREPSAAAVPADANASVHSPQRL